MSGTTFNLPPCPICSTPFGLDRPSWHYAAMTSAKRGHRCHVWTGCRHAAGPRGASGDIVDDPDAISAKEEWWRAEAVRLFDQMTSGWTPEARRARADILDDLANFRGVPMQRRLNLSA